MRRPLAACVFAAIFAMVASADGASPDAARLSKDPSGLFWFMHISDLHIGANLIEGPNAKPHLAFALGEAVTVIKPSFVWATGDLQDGSGKIGIDGTGIPTSGQSQTQWDWYKQIYQGAAMKVGFYFDLVGNHDVYGDQGATYYLANSLWGSTQHKTWMDFKVVTARGEYRFVGLDSTNDYFKPLSNCCPGFLDDQIAELDAWLQKNADAKLVFVAAHHSLDGNGSYPTANADRVRALLKANNAFYIHGDMHEYKEYLDSSGVVVNEIGSLGKAATQNIGVGVVDHDAFVYRATDVEAAWPFAILTTPVSASLRDGEVNPWAYSVCKNRVDNPFRAVTFSYEVPTKVAVKVGGLPEVDMAPVTASFDFSYPVWQAQIDTRSLPAGLVDITVRVEAAGGARTDTVRAKFDDGACAPLPDQDPSADAGPVDAGDDAGTDADAAPSADAGADAPTTNASASTAVTTASASGCSCRVGAPSEPAGSTKLLAAAFGVVGVALARRRRAARAARVTRRP